MEKSKSRNSELSYTLKTKMDEWDTLLEKMESVANTYNQQDGDRDMIQMYLNSLPVKPQKSTIDELNAEIAKCGLALEDLMERCEIGLLSEKNCKVLISKAKHITQRRALISARNSTLQSQ